MKTIWVIMRGTTIMGWCLTREFAEQVLAVGETIIPKEVDEDAYLRLQVRGL